MKKELVKLANHLDRIGQGDLADRIDLLLSESKLKISVAQDDADNADAEAAAQAVATGVMNVLDMPLSEAIDKAFQNDSSAIGEAVKRYGSISFFTRSGTGVTSGEPSRSSWLSSLSADKSVKEQWDEIQRVDSRLTDKFLEISPAAVEWISSRESPPVASPAPATDSSPATQQEDEVNDYAKAYFESEERIEKLASLMSYEFNSGVPSSFKR